MNSTLVSYKEGKVFGTYRATVHNTKTVSTDVFKLFLSKNKRLLYRSWKSKKVTYYSIVIGKLVLSINYSPTDIKFQKGM